MTYRLRKTTYRPGWFGEPAVLIFDFIDRDSGQEISATWLVESRTWQNIIPESAVAFLQALPPEDQAKVLARQMEVS